MENFNLPNDINLIPENRHAAQKICLAKASPTPSLNSRILLSKHPPQRLHTLYHPPKLILLLAPYLPLLRRIFFLITPLDLKRREVQLRVESVDIFVVVGREAAKRGDKGEEFADIVSGGRLECVIGGVERWVEGRRERGRRTEIRRPSSRKRWCCWCSSSCGCWRRS